MSNAVSVSNFSPKYFRAKLLYENYRELFCLQDRVENYFKTLRTFLKKIVKFIIMYFYEIQVVMKTNLFI